jgi:hypothetical protein
MQDEETDVKLRTETVLLGAALFCLAALFATITAVRSNDAPAPSAIAYPIDASHS